MIPFIFFIDNVEIVDLLLANMRFMSKKDSREVKEKWDLMLSAVIGRNSQILSLLLQNQFYIPTSYRGYSLLKWSEILDLPEIHRILKAAGATSFWNDKCYSKYTDSTVINDIISHSVKTLENVSSH